MADNLVDDGRGTKSAAHGSAAVTYQLSKLPNDIDDGVRRIVSRWEVRLGKEDQGLESIEEEEDRGREPKHQDQDQEDSLKPTTIILKHYRGHDSDEDPPSKSHSSPEGNEDENNFQRKPPEVTKPISESIVESRAENLPTSAEQERTSMTENSAAPTFAAADRGHDSREVGNAKTSEPEVSDRDRRHLRKMKTTSTDTEQDDDGHDFGVNSRHPNRRMKSADDSTDASGVRHSGTSSRRSKTNQDHGQWRPVDDEMDSP